MGRSLLDLRQYKTEAFLLSWLHPKRFRGIPCLDCSAASAQSCIRQSSTNMAFTVKSWTACDRMSSSSCSSSHAYQLAAWSAYEAFTEGAPARYSVVSLSVPAAVCMMHLYKCLGPNPFGNPAPGYVMSGGSTIPGLLQATECRAPGFL